MTEILLLVSFYNYEIVNFTGLKAQRFASLLAAQLRSESKHLTPEPMPLSTTLSCLSPGHKVNRELNANIMLLKEHFKRHEITVFITDEFYCASKSPTKFVKDRGSDPTTKLVNQCLPGKIQGVYFLKDSDKHTSLKTTYLKPSADNKFYSFCNIYFVIILLNSSVIYLCPDSSST